MSPMARPRTFDVDHAVEQAMDLFWRKGYEATSLSDLLDELHLGRGSLYQAFGSKDELYERALNAYCARHAAGLVELLDQTDDVRAALRELLRALAAADRADPERGCLLVNAATERADHAPTVEVVRTTMRRVESAIAGALERAQARGDLAPDKNPRALASFLTTFLQGLRVMGKARSTRRAVDDAVEVALRALD
jgi:TetR/AcrR family transcriptional regulator, transcriptional repressor for nem operon